MRHLLLLLILSYCYCMLHAQAGTLDPTFGNKGTVRSNLFYAGGEAIARKTFVQPDSTLIVVMQEGGRTALSRFNRDGTNGGDFGMSAAITYGDATTDSNGKIVVAGTTYLGLSLLRFDQYGSGDPDFNGGEPTGADFGSANGRGTAVAIQKDGKIIVAGYTYSGGLARFAIARFDTDGNIDRTFSGDGRQVTSNGNNGAFATGLAIQPDGKIVVCGYAGGYGAKTDFALVRYNMDGSRDLSFNGDGKVLTTVGLYDDRANAITLQPDGKIIVTGTTQLAHGAGSSYAMATVRYKQDGSVDASFGINGIAVTAVGTVAEAKSIVLQSDNKIVVAGDTKTGASEDFAIVRYNSNGSLDASFSGNGKQQIDFLNRAGHVTAATLQPDGKIILTGYIESNRYQQREFVLARLTRKGVLDTGFGKAGKVTQYFSTGSTAFRSTVVQSDGKLLAVGYTESNYFYEDFTRFALARYRPDGTFDSTFGTNGKVLTAFDKSFGSSGNAVGLQRDGKIIVGGDLYNMQNVTGFSSEDFVLMRYTTKGLADSTFGVNGKLFIDFSDEITGTGFDYLSAIAVQPDGKILAVGGSEGDDGSRRMVIARCTEDGSPDMSFSDDGKLKIGFDDTYFSNANAIAIQPNGKIVIAGSAALETNGNAVFALARIKINGKLDSTFHGDGRRLSAIGTSSSIRALAVQSNSKIVAAGSSDGNFAIVRFSATGYLDRSFNDNGTVIADFGGEDDINAIALQPDGKLVAAGAGNNRFALARYKINGTLDSSFADDGKQTTAIDSSTAAIQGIAIYGNRLYAAGSGAPYSGVVAAYRLDVEDAVTKAIKVNVYGGINPYNNPEWNNWNNLKNLHTGPLYYSDSSVSTISAVMSNRNGIKDNGENYGGAMAPAEVLRYTSYSIGPRTITFSGLAISKTYSFELYASRNAYADNSTVFSVSGQTHTIATYQNLSNKVVFTNLHPDVQGKLVITISSTATYNYLNGFILTERNSTTQTVTQLKKANIQPATENSRLEANVFPNPAADHFTLQITSSAEAPILVRVLDASGRLVEVMSAGAPNANFQFGGAYNPGVYYANVTQGKERKNIKLVKRTK